MLQEDFITRLIDIQDAVIENVQLSEFFIHIHLSLKRKPHVCPACGAITQNVYNYRIQKIKDLPIHGKHVILHYRKRRYRCACCAKKFYENPHILSASGTEILIRSERGYFLFTTKTRQALRARKA